MAQVLGKDRDGKVTLIERQPLQTVRNHPLEVIRDHPQFDVLQHLVHANPAMLEPTLTQIGQEQPDLLHLVHKNWDHFLQMLKEPIQRGSRGPFEPVVRGTGTFFRYKEMSEANFLMSLSDGHHQSDVHFRNGEKAAGNGRKLLQKANYYHLQQIVQHSTTDACDISVDSVPVSVAAHDQEEGTCYAHACATAIRAVERRIVGRKPTPFRELVNKIIQKYGNDGGSPAEALEEQCEDRRLRCEIIDDDEVLDSLQEGRVVVASFVLKKYQWRLFSAFFRRKPTGVLTRAHFARDSRRETDFPPKLRDIEGHSVVITGCYWDNEKVVYKIKNSWGNAFPWGFDEMLDVWFAVSDLSKDDIRNYLAHLLQGRQGIKVDEKNFIKVRGCSSLLVISTAAMVKQNTLMTTERRAIRKILNLWDNDENVTVSKSGTVEVAGSKYNFRVDCSRFQGTGSQSWRRTHSWRRPVAYG